MQTRQVLGERYRLEERLGAGGMSVVWKAFDLVLGRSVAVKVLAGRHATDAHVREGVLSEAQAAARVTHPNLASVHDYGESLDPDGRTVPYVVMELLVGPTLLERLASGPLPPHTGLRICAEIAAALAAVHAHNLVHRDVKPGNVMLTSTGAKLVDFGVAAIVGAPGLDRDGRIIGTPNYVAPERLLGDPVEPASDVYGLGLLIFRVLTGGLPWPPGAPSLATRADPAPLPDLDGVPGDINELYLRCVSIQAHERPSASEAAELLASAVTGLGLEADTDDGSHAAIPIGSTAPADSVFRLGADSETTVATRRPRVAAVVLSAAAATLATVLVINNAGRPHADPPGAEAPPGAATSPGATASTISTAAADPTRPVDRNPAVGGDPLLAPGITGPPGTVPTVVRSTTPTVAPTTAPPTPTGWATFDTAGGSIVAACFVTLAYLDSWEAAPGYMVQRVERGPAIQAGISFRSSDALIRITVRCVDGQPRPRAQTRTQPPPPPPSS